MRWRQSHAQDCHISQAHCRLFQGPHSSDFDSCHEGVYSGRAGTRFFLVWNGRRNGLAPTTWASPASWLESVGPDRPHRPGGGGRHRLVRCCWAWRGVASEIRIGIGWMARREPMAPTWRLLKNCVPGRTRAVVKESQLVHMARAGPDHVYLVRAGLVLWSNNRDSEVGMGVTWDKSPEGRRRWERKAKRAG